MPSLPIDYVMNKRNCQSLGKKSQIALDLMKVFGEYFQNISFEEKALNDKLKVILKNIPKTRQTITAAPKKATSIKNISKNISKK